MSAKNVFAAILGMFVLAAIGWLVLDGMRGGDEATATATGEPAAAAAAVPAQPAAAVVQADVAAGQPRVIAYYFHRTMRCNTCMKIERYTQEAFERSFAGELEEGVLDFRVLNLDDPENEHFLEDFDLSAQSVVLVETGAQPPERWKNLMKVWDLVGDKVAFLAYIRQETRDFLHAG